MKSAGIDPTAPADPQLAYVYDNCLTHVLHAKASPCPPRTPPPPFVGARTYLMIGDAMRVVLFCIQVVRGEESSGSKCLAFAIQVLTQNITSPLAADLHLLRALPPPPSIQSAS